MDAVQFVQIITVIFSVGCIVAFGLGFRAGNAWS